MPVGDIIFRFKSVGVVLEILEVIAAMILAWNFEIHKRG